MDVRRAYAAVDLARTASVTSISPRPAPATPPPASRPAEPGVRVDISASAGLLGQLASLRAADHTEFKHFMGEVGSNLKAAANADGGDVSAQLGALADQLLRVAKTGELAALTPQLSLGAPSPHRAVAAYRQNAPAAAPPSSAVSQALAYVREAAAQRLPTT